MPFACTNKKKIWKKFRYRLSVVLFHMLRSMLNISLFVKIILHDLPRAIKSSVTNVGELINWELMR